ncbi:MAG: hypothetical protein KDA65_19655 [Planctomycetaceae bacterium]|nr:hypothetical protein [Planctomycetaceae bacterium]
MDRYTAKLWTAWGLVIASIAMIFLTYPGRYSGRIMNPGLADFLGTPVLLILLAGLLYVCYLCRSWLGVGILFFALCGGALAGTWREYKHDRYVQRTYGRHFQGVPVWRGAGSSPLSQKHDWTRHKLLAGVSFGGIALGAAMIKDKI